MSSAIATARRRRAFSLLACLTLPLLGGCARLLGARPISHARAGHTTFHTLRVDGRTRSFLLHLPRGARRGTPVPLLLVFHGHNGNANVARETTRLEAEADRRGIAVAYPNGTGPLGFLGLAWNARTCCGHAQRHGVDDVAFAAALVRALAREAGIDSTRVYAAGFSAGGMLALRVACERAELVVGVADVAGAMPDSACVPARPVTVLLVQGDRDGELRFDLRTLLRHGHHFARSLEAALRFWARVDHCAEAFTRDSTPALRVEHADECSSGTAVALYTVHGHPHAWPGGRRPWPFAPKPAPVNASTLILDAFGLKKAGTRD